jgi:hypothetical protein
MPRNCGQIGIAPQKAISQQTRSALSGACHARKADGGAPESASTDEQQDEVAGEDILDHGEFSCVSGFSMI